MIEPYSNQPHFWQVSSDNQTYTELCNALYERELLRLANMNPDQLPLLQKRLAALPFYIRRAAANIVTYRSELQLDSQNASWFTNSSVAVRRASNRPILSLTFTRKRLNPS